MRRENTVKENMTRKARNGRDNNGGSFRVSKEEINGIKQVRMMKIL